MQVVPPTYPLPRTNAPFSYINGGQAVYPKGQNIIAASDFSGGAAVEWTKTAGDSIADDAVNTLHGTRSVKMTSVDAVGTIILKTIAATDLSGDVLYVSFYIDDATKLNATTPVQFYWSSTANDASYYTYAPATDNIATGWNLFCLRKNQLTTVGTPDWTQIIRLRARVRAAAGQTVNMTMDYMANVSNDLSKAIVILTFDDGWSSQFSAAKPAMDTYGYAGVAAPICSNVQTANANTVTLAQLHEMKAGGWDIGNHTYAHTNLTAGGVTEADVDRAVGRGLEWLTEAGLEPCDFFVYPMGNYNATVLNAVARHHSYGRTIYNTLAEKTPQFFPQPLTIRAAGPITAANMATNVDAAVANNSVYTQIFHIVDDGAQAAIDPTIAMTPADFATAMAHLDTHVQAGELEVLTFTEALKRMRGEAI